MQTTLKIEGMTCQHCSTRVRQSLSNVQGVQSVDIDLAKGYANVEYDESQVNQTALDKAVEMVGYKVVE
jgi:copper chaperone